ncbi:succinoglycan biosynthesis protein ExoW [Thiohalophilus thiocyanatoxydans]|uniref:Succinoglycan biosynthesis protein ExoW n=2 Tax=Thiohalophilus thiocyanatoxydans TaxID=381308 RepID=A0A4R8IW70_9GAMM|nr:succinoglycan biosynthesis protein ExoW [Thiohalophilus thiocyanatoxydans]
MMSNSSTPEIAVIIPFYQRETGLLTQCVRSILEQPGGVDCQIIVVDDESPIPADQELARFLPDAGDRLRIIHQPNAGPGAARNTGLDNVPPGTPYVTFLDSDDQWTGPFLSDAVAALEQGYDLFMGNSTRVGSETSRFEWDKNPVLNIHPADHKTIDPERALYEYQGDFFDLLIRRSNIIGPTTMAYRFDRFAAVRFDPTIYNGQDRLFKLTLGQDFQRVAFSPKLYAYEGEGINIFDKSQWGTAGSIRLLSSYIRLSRRILATIRLNPEQRAYVRHQLADSRRSFALSIPHLLKKGVSIDWRRVMATFREDPLCAMLFLPNLARGFLAKRH